MVNISRCTRFFDFFTIHFSENYMTKMTLIDLFLIRRYCFVSSIKSRFYSIITMSLYFSIHYTNVILNFFNAYLYDLHRLPIMVVFSFINRKLNNHEISCKTCFFFLNHPLQLMGYCSMSARLLWYWLCRHLQYKL